MNLKYFIHNSDLIGNIDCFPIRICIDLWIQDYNYKYLYQKIIMVWNTLIAPHSGMCQAV